MNLQINPNVYSKKYAGTNTPYWLVKCQLPNPTPEDPGATKTYQKKHPTASQAELDKTRLMREYGGGSVSIEQLKEFELGLHRLQTCDGDARGKPPLTAIEWFIANYKDPSHTPLVEEAVKNFHAKHASNLRQKSREEYEVYLDRFIQHFGKTQVGGITTQILQEFVDAYPSPLHHRKCLLGLFAFCSGGSRKIQSPHKWIESNPASGVVVVEDKVDKEIVILTLEEVKAALAVALLIGDLPYWIWSLFTGMRPEETKKFWTLDGYGWDRVNLGGGYIIVNSEIAKDKRRRKTLIRPVLMEWLHYFRATGEPMFPTSHRKQFREIKRSAIADNKFLINDLLRHTYISNRVQHFDKSLATTAAESGNSEKIIKEHYLDLITDEASILEYWSLTPSCFGLTAPSPEMNEEQEAEAAA